MIEDFTLDNNFYYSIVDGGSLDLRGAAKGNVINPDDPDRVYKVNSYGYRGKEFSAGDDLLVAGCSYTFGLGVPDETVWHNLLAEEMGLSKSSSISKPGASISWIVEKIFAYFSEFGHPKYLLCLLPDPHRFVVPLDGVVLDEDPNAKRAVGESGTFGVGAQRLYNSKAKHPKDMADTKYIKKPYNIRDIYTSEMALYGAIRSIRLLEQYCKGMGIKLIWSTWDGGFLKYLEKIQSSKKLKFKNFFDLNMIHYKKKFSDGRYIDLIYHGNINNVDSYFYDCIQYHVDIDCNCPASCHRELIDVYGEENFFLGTDTARGEEYSHPGIHVQRHYADRFIEQLMLEFPNDFK